MTLQILEAGNSIPFSHQVAEHAQFQAGSAMALTVIGGRILAVPSNGQSFFGVVDDVNTTAFSAVAWDEEIVAGPISSSLLMNDGTGQLITTIDIKVELENPNVNENYFSSDPVPVQLIPRNGVVVFPAGTPVNLDLGGFGQKNSIKTFVRYSYQIPNIPGDSSVIGSQRVAIWFQRMIFSTDQFEVNQEYRVMSNIFVNEHGLFTTRKIYPNSPIVASCLAPPSGITKTLQLMLL